MNGNRITDKSPKEGLRTKKSLEQLTRNELLDLIIINKQQRKDILTRKVWNKRRTNFKISLNEFKLPKWIRKQTRELKAIARNILWENYLDYFNLGENNEKEIDKKKIKTVKFNEIEIIWETYWESYESYQKKVLEKMINFKYPEQIELNFNSLIVNSDESYKTICSHPVYLDWFIKLKWDNNYKSILYLSNNYNGLTYIWKDIPQEDTTLYVISKLIQQKIKEYEKMIVVAIQSQSFIVDRIRNIPFIQSIWDVRVKNNLSNIEIYNYIIVNYPEIIEKTVANYIEILNKMTSIALIFKEEYPHFQMHFNINESWYDNEFYKKGIVIKAIKEIRKWNKF